MKKFIISTLVGLGLSLSLKADTISVTVAGTNFQQVLSAPAIITGYSLTASTNALVGLIDTPTNLPTYTIPGYTNTISYATNTIVRWTNCFGQVNSWTNISLVDITNNAVASSTGTYPRKAAVATLGGTTTTVAPTYMVIDNGLWVTNYSTNTAVLTIQFRQ